jgi:hypothetical protein
MAIEFVLIDTAPGKTESVYHELEKLMNETDVPAIRYLHPLFGEHDLIVKVEANDFNEMGLYVTDEIIPTHGIISTKVLTGIRF